MRFGWGLSMLIRCLHGYFIFKERFAGDVSRFMAIFQDLSIVAVDDYFTFEFLANSPTHVIAGDDFLGAPCLVTAEGRPWEIMRANNIVYDFQLEAVVPILTVTKRLELAQGSNYAISPGLIMPGSLSRTATRVRDYTAYHNTETQDFRYSEVSYE